MKPDSSALGLAAFGAVFALPDAAEAGIVYSGLQNISVSWAEDGKTAFTSLFINGDAKADLIIGGVASAASDSFGPYGWAGIGSAGKGKSFIAGVGVSSFSAYAVANFKAGKAIGVSSPSFAIGGFLHYFSSTSSSPFTSGNFLSGETGMAPFFFYDGFDVHFGWIRLRWDDLEGDPRTPNRITAIDWAYNDVPFQSILSGDSVVPEGNSVYGMLGVAGVALATWRARRRADRPPQ